MMRILRNADYRRMPWKNGGGETREIAASPEGASLDNFDWRLSMARVASDGPFSQFPGIERTLSVLEGNGIVLTIEGMPPILLGKARAPFGFDASVKAEAALKDGPIVDLNVMSRKGRARHHCYRILVEGKVDLEAKTTVIFSIADELTVDDGKSKITLGHYDCAVIQRSENQSLTVSGGDCYVTDIN